MNWIDDDGGSLDTAALAIRLRQALIPLLRQMRSHQDGLTQGLMSALGTVTRKGPLTLGELAGYEKVSPSMATKLTTTLARRGLVVRRPCLEDKRVVRIASTQSGRELLDRAKSHREAWLTRRFETLERDELAAIAAAVDVIERLSWDEPLRRASRV